MGEQIAAQANGQHDPMRELRVTIDELKGKLLGKDEEIVRLRLQIEKMQKMLFGPTSEKRVLATDDVAGRPGALPFPELEQLHKDLEKARAERETSEVEVEGHRRKRHGRRKDFPEHLPRKETEIDVSESEMHCPECGKERKRIGKEVTQELERIEVTYVHRIVRIKRACPDKTCPGGAVTAPLPGRVIDKGILGPGFIAHVIYERFGNHMPYYRLEQKYKAEGLPLSRTVLCETALRCAEMFTPVYEAHKQEVLSSYVVQSDDTPVTQRNGKDKGRRVGRMWAYRAQEGGVFFEYRPDRSRASPLEVLGHRKGYVQADAYSGYDELFETSGCIEIGCWAHARRKFDEAKSTEPKLADEILDLIVELYQVEREAKEQGLDTEDRLRLRQRRSVPLLEQIKDWLEGTLPDVLPKSPMATAIQYVLRQWEALRRFSQDGGILEIDNNGCERMIRPIAVGRRNWLFVGSREGGEKSAVLMSLVNSCKELGINPLDYLRDVLIQIDVTPASEIHRLTPRGWKADQEAACRAQASREAIAAVVASMTFNKP